MPLGGWNIYFYRDNAWSNPMSSSGPPPGEAAAASVLVPDGVRLLIDLPPGQALAGQITRDWVNPLKGGGKT